MQERKSIPERYVKYLKDNPEGYWFRRKLFGWGWTPARVPGWIATFAYAAVLVYIFVRVDRSSHSASDTLLEIFIPFVVVTLIFIALALWKGERPGWMWGFPREDKDKF